MTQVAQYLIKNYYTRYTKVKAPAMKTLVKLCFERKDRMVIIQDDRIKGVAIYLTLTDETYRMLKDIDIANADAQMAFDLFRERGKNIHFIMLAADCLRTILKGVREVVKREHPRTVSWFNPDHTKLHTRRF